MKSFLASILFSAFVLSNHSAIATEPKKLASVSINAQTPTPTEEFVDFKTSTGISIPIPTQDYLDLVDGKISEFRTSEYFIRRRLGTRPVAYEDDRTKLFNLYFDVFKVVSTKIHNHPKPAPTPQKI